MKSPRHSPASGVLRFLLLAAISLLDACGSLPAPPANVAAADEAVLTCVRYYQDLTEIIGRNHVKDAQSIAVKGYSYLHVNRFLTSLKPRLTRQDKLTQWVTLLAQLALQTHTLEIHNLPAEAQQALANMSPTQFQGGNNLSVLQQCSQTLLQHALSSPANLQHIVQNANVPDDYRTWQRIVGLYPLVALPVASGINKWHKQSTAVLTTPTGDLPVAGALVRYTGADTSLAYENFADIRLAINASRQNALHIPLPDSTTQQRLFASFSPIWEVDTVQNADKIGAATWQSNEAYPTADIARPTVYTLASHAYFNHEILLQLNYIVWFPSRPCTSALDLLCGNLDGLTWRVTLGTDGKPLIYDTIHNCGCYHSFFPTESLRPIPPAPITADSRSSLDETAFTPIDAPAVGIAQHLVVRLEHRTHYIESLYIDTKTQSDAVLMATEPYDTLRSLPFSDKHNKSLFQENALVVGSQRKERWFFWPLGVPSAGAMRQWGHHATAFIGRRHFDDPYLLIHSFIAVQFQNDENG